MLYLSLFALFSNPAAQPPEVIDAYNLQNAVRNGNSEEVKKQISMIKDINTQYNGRDALHVAIEEGNKEIVELLLGSGAEVNSRRDEGKGITTLQHAIRSFKCTVGIITLLLDKRADVNTAGPEEILAINEAVRRSGDKAESLAMLSLLIEKGADVNPDITGNSPLINSILHQRPDMTEVLLKNKADVNRPAQNGKYPIHFAVENKQIESLKLLLAHGVQKDVKNAEGQTALNYAKTKASSKYLDPVSKKKYQEIVRLLSK